MAASTWERFVNTDPLSLPSTFSIDECLDFPMSSLEYNFILLKYCGIWCPLEWSSGWKTRFYSCYTAIVVAVVFTISSADMIKTLLSIGYVEEFAEGMLLLLTLISCCGKILTLLVHRQRIILLFETFKCPVCQATNSQEAAVRKTSHQSMRTRTDGFICVMVSTMMLMTIRCITTNIPRRTLPLRIWLPFDVDTEKVYWLVFFVEFFSLFFAGIIDIAYATLVPTFMSSICEQFGLLECRIQLFILSIENSQYPEKHRIQFEKKQFVDSVQHHLLLFQFANEANDIFGPALLMQYISSITVISQNPLYLALRSSSRCLSIHISKSSNFHTHYITFFSNPPKNEFLPMKI
ncbi:hypothetical protein PV327_005569 [Microctonus hyperodae]|uniref:Odorant receptor n=1 Tax=Microctonus hyperodae TaxID=165561 RepID=A0AA39KZP0_MICHY|nr:hypothetical protein PV327_005569 [Microctonus hyperodae]